MSEIWTAATEEGEFINFDVVDEQTGETRQERRYKDAIPVMLMLGGYPLDVGIHMQQQPLPWRFRKSGEHIYIDGPSIGVDDYHPIADADN